MCFLQFLMLVLEYGQLVGQGLIVFPGIGQVDLDRCLAVLLGLKPGLQCPVLGRRGLVVPFGLVQFGGHRLAGRILGNPLYLVFAVLQGPVHVGLRLLPVAAGALHYAGLRQLDLAHAERDRAHNHLRLGLGAVGAVLLLVSLLLLVQFLLPCLVVRLAGHLGGLQLVTDFLVQFPQALILGLVVIPIRLGPVRPGRLALAGLPFAGQGILQCRVFGLAPVRPVLGRPGFLLLGGQLPGILPVLFVVQAHPAGLLARCPARHVEGLGANVLRPLHPGLVHVSHLAVLQVRVRQVDMVVALRLPGLIVQVAFVAMQVPPHAANVQALFQALDQLLDVHLFSGLGAVDHGLAEQLHAVVDLTGAPAVLCVIDVFLAHLVAGQALAAFLVAARIRVPGKRGDVRRRRVIPGPLALIVGLAGAGAAGDLGVETGVGHCGSPRSQ